MPTVVLMISQDGICRLKPGKGIQFREAFQMASAKTARITFESPRRGDPSGPASPPQPEEYILT
jgi:hypothetical protein